MSELERRFREMEEAKKSMGTRDEALDNLSGLFRRIGENRQSGGQNQPNDAVSGLLGQVEEFVSMPMDLAVIFLNMSVELAELVLTSLEEAGFTLVKGMTPL